MDLSKIARVQGTFNVVSGIWPLVHMRSFEAVSGPKTDKWLVRTVAGLLVTVGVAQLRAARDADSIGYAKLLGIGTAGTLAAIDLTYAAQGRISRIYLVDAAVELLLIRNWLRNK